MTRKNVFNPTQTRTAARITLLLLLLLFHALPTMAVLKEENLEQSLHILRSELTKSYYEQQQYIAMTKLRNEQARNELTSTIRRSDQNALMLYSQQYDYVFDLTYACNEATELYNEFSKRSLPFDNIIEYYDSEVNRYDSLVNSLHNIAPHMLSETAAADRNVCLTLATAISNQLKSNKSMYEEDIRQNDEVKYKLKQQHEYARKRYNDLQQSIFINGGDRYTAILAKFKSYSQQALFTMQKKYHSNLGTDSQWSGNYILMLFAGLIVFFLLATGINVLAIRLLMPFMSRRHWLPKHLSSDDFRKKRPYVIQATTIITFAIILGLIKTMSSQNFFIMASDLLIEYAWLMGVILFSLIVRLNGDQIKWGYRVYYPVIIMCLIVIIFRIILIPNIMVNLVFPPVLVFFAFWQWRALKVAKKALKKEDRMYAWITLLAFLFSVGASWMGYTLLSVQVIIWWVMQLTCILTITFIHELMNDYERSHYSDDSPISMTWFFKFFNNVILPVAGVASVMVSIYWAAEVFDLQDLCWSIYTKDFVHQPNLSISIMRVSMVLSLFFLFRYLVNTCREMLKLHFSSTSSVGEAGNKAVMGTNALRIVIWGIFLLLVMNILNVGNTWLVVISGGLATGVGFASKDILENIYYGISLMTGRIHIGDMIEIDGVRGTVENINYTSTMIAANDGSVIAFQNSQLFTKNYKNLTKNHGWEFSSLTVGVAYGSNIERVRRVLLDAVSALADELDAEGLHWIDKPKGISVIFTGFGDSSVDLNITCWVNVKKQYWAKAKIRECVYDCLNRNNIEIPFPQRDVYIKSASK